MRLHHRAIAHEMVTVGLEFEAIHLAAETRQFDGPADILRRQRLVVSIRKEVELRRDAGLEDGDLEGEVAIAKHTAAMWATLEIGGSGTVFACRVVDVSVLPGATRTKQ
jgi:hypothetical protein